jgi:hypothetical protein
LEVHVRQAEPGRFLSGGYFKLPMELSRAITRDDILAGRATNPVWLRAHGLRWSRKILKLTSGPRLAWMLDRLTTTKASWNGQNSSGWKTDILRVNGFDERMEIPGEDLELGERLTNLGIRGKRIRYRAICVHLDHSRGYVRPEALPQNLKIRRETRRNRAVFTAYGIINLAQPGSAGLKAGSGELRLPVRQGPTAQSPRAPAPDRSNLHPVSVLEL